MNRSALRRSWLLLASILGAAIASSVAAGELLVTADWLADRLTDDRLVLLHVGERETYDAGHIPGARHVAAHREFSHPDSHGHAGLVLELPELESLRPPSSGWACATILGSWSISPTAS